MTAPTRTAKIATALMATAIISGCASTNNPKDPYENFNRAMFSFNDTVDKVALKPVATAYRAALPSFVQTGVGNFFGNIGDVWTAINNLLQGKLEDGMSDVARVALNSSFGLLGVLDIATEAGLPKHHEDFGQTLGKWGGEPGPYVVLPLLGSSTVRDTISLPVDYLADPWGYMDPVYVRNIGYGVRVIDRRAGALDASDLIEEAALDKYEFVRDAYLQRRQYLIDDGRQKHNKNNENSTLQQHDDQPARGNAASTSSGMQPE